MYCRLGPFTYHCNRNAGFCTVGPYNKTVTVSQAWAKNVLLYLYCSFGNIQYNCNCTALLGPYNITMTVLQVWTHTVLLYLYCGFGQSQYNSNCTACLGLYDMTIPVMQVCTIHYKCNCTVGVGSYISL